ncbi:MAG: hypothetical protein HFJ97_03545 [Eubacterium sp.]|nr:hypothetical protein [Eubacterium sp.]
MRAYNLFNKIHNSALLAFIISSVFILIAELLQLLGYHISNEADVVLLNFSQLLLKLVPYVFCYFISMHFTNSERWLKAFWAVVCLCVFETASGISISFFAGIVAALMYSYFFERFNKYISFSVTLLSSVVFGLAMSYLGDIFKDILMGAARFVSDKGLVTAVLFSVISTVLCLFGSNSFNELFYYKSYGGTIVKDDNVITGIKDLFENGYSGEQLADYMTGHYFLLFVILGVMLALADELKAVQKICLLITMLCSFISGDISLALFFVFLESPFLFILITIISAICHVTAHLLDIRMGYLFSGSIVEMFGSIDKPVYFFVCAVVFVAIGYFVTRYSNIKAGISDCLNIYIPTRFNHLLNALGGIVNIIKVNDDVAEVRNPKLVNTFDLKCEIRENLVKVEDDEIKELGEYLQ